jgi:ribosomal protein S6--L-glutamate ligase
MKKILSINIGSKEYSQQHIAACEDLGIEQQKIRARYCCIVLDQGDVHLYHRGLEIDLQSIEYGFIRVRGKYALMVSLMARLLQAHRIPFNDASNLEHTANEEKITQMLQFTLAGIPIPKTALFVPDAFKENEALICQHIGFPAVLKLNGSRGDVVWKVESKEDLYQKIARLDRAHKAAMLQELIPNTYDIRALYVYGECLGAIKRSAADGFYNNVSKGGSTAVIELTEEECDLLRRACEVLERDFGGVDIVRSDRGPLLFEVNLAPQITGFTKTTGINVPQKVLEKIKELFLK